MTIKQSGSLLLIAVATVFGFKVAISSFDGVVFVSSTTKANARNPAAIRRDLDFSRLDGAELITASQKRLVTAARVILEHDDMGLELGHFVTRGEDGERQLACDYYDRVSLRFEAEGIAESGEKSVMEVDGPCRTGNDITRIDPIWIPVQRILGERPTNMDLTYPDVPALEGISFHFDHMGTQWPSRWALQMVRLYHEDEPGREVTISERDLREILDRPVILNWRF